jgi:hypothetical protein
MAGSFAFGSRAAASGVVLRAILLAGAARWVVLPGLSLASAAGGTAMRRCSGSEQAVQHSLSRQCSPRRSCRLVGFDGTVRPVRQR